jgi:hypothetical protein
MGVGHAAVAIVASRAIPRLNAGWLVFASLFADFLLGVFGLLGLEGAHVPPEYPARHYLTFTFPYSHGLLPLLAWAILLGALVAAGLRLDRKRAFAVVALVALSHFFLDALVHVVGLPLWGENSPKVGLGLWGVMPLELALETLMSIAGVIIFWKSAASSALSRYGVAGFMLLLCAATWSPLFMSAPPDVAQLVPGWIASPLIFGAMVYGFDRRRAAIASS